MIIFERDWSSNHAANGRAVVDNNTTNAERIYPWCVQYWFLYGFKLLGGSLSGRADRNPGAITVTERNVLR
jgi:hypothetical protein